jgi:ankyrin repeat protein
MITMNTEMRGGKNHTSGAPLHFAAEYCYGQNIELLLDHAANVNIADMRGNTALHRTQDPKTAEMLIAAGINMYAVDAQGMSAFHLAAARSWVDNGDPEDPLPGMVTTILRHGFPVDQLTSKTSETSGGTTALQIACGNGYSSTVEFLIEKGASINHQDNDARTSLH